MSEPPDGDAIRVGLIGGSGLGEALGGERGEAVEVDTPFGPPAAPIVLTQWAGVEVAILRRHGVGHVFNPSDVPYRANVFALKKLGCTHVVASGATGSLRDEYAPGELVLVDQFIDKTCRREPTFYDRDAGAVVHVEFSEPTCPTMRGWLRDAASRGGGGDGDASGGGAVKSDGSGGDGSGSDGSGGGVAVHDGGTYVCMEGPAFSTQAESMMHRGWKGDLIGMTAMPEAKLCREAELPYALIGMPTDYDAWRPHPAGKGQHELLPEIIANLEHATANAIALIRAALADTTPLREHACLGADALRLAIWSDKAAVPREKVDRLKPLWGRHF